MSTLRLYAAAEVVVLWATLVALGVTDGATVWVVLRLVTFAAGLVLSLRESVVVVAGDRRRRRRG